MPYIKFPKRPTVRWTSFNRAIRVVTFMLWPKADSKFRNGKLRHVFAILSEAALKRPKSSQDEPRRPFTDVLQHRLTQFATEPKSFALEVTSGDWLPSRVLGLGRPTADYVTVAFVALTIVGLQNRSAQPLNGAVKMASFFLSELQLTWPGKEKWVPADKSDITRKWGKLKHVAHFWAAYVLMSPDFGAFGIMGRNLRIFLALSHRIAAQLNYALKPKVDFWLIKKYEGNSDPDIVVPFDSKYLDDFLDDYAANHLLSSHRKSKIKANATQS